MSGLRPRTKQNRPRSRQGNRISPPFRHLRAITRSLLAAVIVASFLFVFLPSVALAHAYPVRSSPAPNATVARSPNEVDIWFGESLEPHLSNLVVYDAVRHDVTLKPSEVDPAQPTHLSVALRPELPQGTYTVVWHVVSSADGHSTAGVFAFGIGVAARAPVIVPRQLGAANGQAASSVGILGRWLTYLGESLVFGTATFALFVYRLSAGRGLLSTSSSTGGARDKEALRWLTRAAILALLLGQLLRLSDELTLTAVQNVLGASPAVNLGTVLLGSRFGALWLGRLALLGIAAVLEVAFRLNGQASPWRWTAMLAIGVGLISDQAWSGHAAAGSLLAYASLIQSTVGWGTKVTWYLPVAAVLVAIAKPLTLVIDWLHLVSVAAWLGGLPAVAGVATAALSSKDPEEHEALIATVARFSRLAGWAMLIVLFSGLYNTWLYLAGSSPYLSTDFGQSLLLKHVFFIGLLFVATINHVVTVPVLTTGRPRWRWLARFTPSLSRHWAGLLWSEAVVGLLVLLSAGLLTSLAPTRNPWQILVDPTRELALGSSPFQTSLATDQGRTVALTINPGRLGPNRFVARLKAQSLLPSKVDRAYLELTSLDLGGGAEDVITLEPEGVDQFTAEGLVPSAEGIWRAKLLFYHDDGSVEAATTTFQITATWSATVDPGAKALLDRAADAMDRLHSARMIESLSDGASGIALSSYTFVAPDIETIQTPSGSTVIHQGDTVYQYSTPHVSGEEVTGAPTYVWPSGDFDYLRTGVGGIVVGSGTIHGQRCTIVSFYTPSSQAIYEEWIAADGLIYQEVMAAPSHFMVDRYFDFNQITGV